MTNILLTGGRAPATLDLARAFHRAGHTVFMAESLRGHLSQSSNAIEADFVVPAPRQDRAGFVDALKNIITQNQVEIVIPTCEEIFHISKEREQFPCAVFAEPINILDHLHNKWHFVINAIGNELYAPETMFLNTLDDVLHAYAHWRDLVLKPVYSRFATRTLIRPSLKQTIASVPVSPRLPWIAQEYMIGRAYCTYSVCHNGQITAHTTYPSKFTAGQGATIAFEHVEHPGIFHWVKRFVRKNHFNGQIAFDFIETDDGIVYALECNPRATSGVHLLASHPQFAEAFFNPQLQTITPVVGHKHMLSTAMLVYGLPRAITNGEFINWLKTFFSSDDVILDFRDILPFFLQFRSVFAYLSRARKHGISALEASTYDIEWNGEIIETGI